MTWRSFKEAREFAHSLKLNSQVDWRKYCKSGKKPNDIPAEPERIYKNKGWVNTGDWLGTGRIAYLKKQYSSFSEARKLVRSLKLKNHNEWMVYRKSNKKPDYIPTDPTQVYKNKGWKNFGDWLGTGTISKKIKFANVPPWSESKIEYRRLAKKFGIKTQKDWIRFAKTHKKLLDELNLPAAPWMVYSKERVWKRMNK